MLSFKISCRWTLSSSFQWIHVSCYCFFLNPTYTFCFLKLLFYFSYPLSTNYLKTHLDLLRISFISLLQSVLCPITTLKQLSPVLIVQLNSPLFLNLFGCSLGFDAINPLFPWNIFDWYPSHYTGQVSPYFRKPPCFPGFFTSPLHYVYRLSQYYGHKSV